MSESGVEVEMLEAAIDGEDWQLTSRQVHLKRQKKNQTEIDQFIDSEARTYTSVTAPDYYGDLLAWALETYLKRNNWEILYRLGYRNDRPDYTGIQVSAEETLDLMTNGQLLIRQGEVRIAATLDVTRRGAALQLESKQADQCQLDTFKSEIKRLISQENFYKGQKIEYTGFLHFIKPAAQIWDSVIINPEDKEEIYLNSIHFLNNQTKFVRLGIPGKRGILLVGEPGTGKTIICKALMSKAKGITCLTTDCYSLSQSFYVDELYKIARELSPSIVFIEDLDLIGKSRDEFGGETATPLSALLAALDGLEANYGVVTIATTNLLEQLDDALIRRPARFDRVIKLSRPDLPQRQEIINRICRKIRLSDEVRKYLAAKTAYYTPAQLQEVIYSLVIITQAKKEGRNDLGQLTKSDIDNTLRRIYGIKDTQIGFNLARKI
ncbi:AAA family ATPase [Dehalococcoides sp. THU3]|uniref:AAA family ATPase n=1 Tax=Dehalococcoides TaxID=61434 RepID=UPI0005B56587|nr:MULTISPECIES: AAA family ATPase [Dehalococcoides]QYY58824.2 AAA family ATPase [Dehalococcoides mccartyi]BAQ35279.1 putative ATPase [Dehalococcoides sp. UCH007]